MPTTTITDPVISLQEAMRNQGVTSIKELAHLSGVSIGPIVRVLDPANDRAINETCAERIASALGTRIDKIRWPHGTTPEGRTAGTGVPITRRSPRAHQYKKCGRCNLLMPATDVCENCL